jgi:hypothetical protein
MRNHGQLWWRMQGVRDVRQRHFPQALQHPARAGLNLPWNPRAGLDTQMTGGWHVPRLLLRDNLLNRSKIERAYRKRHCRGARGNHHRQRLLPARKAVAQVR